MPIMNVAEEYPPGYIGDPYNGDDISKFFDLNWPDHAGILGQGYSAPGIGRLGQTCISQDEAGDCLQYSSDPTTTATTPVVTTLPGASLDPTDMGGSSCPAGYETDPTTGLCTQYSCGAGYSYGGGICTANPATTGAVVASGTPNQANYTAQQVAAITAAGGSAVSIIRTAEGGPYTVAGTNLVYNPATGQLTTAAAVNATASVTSALSSLTPYIPYIALAIGAIVLLPMLTGKK